MIECSRLAQAKREENMEELREKGWDCQKRVTEVQAAASGRAARELWLSAGSCAL